MKIKQINHVGINVSDINRSLAFYRDLLGFGLLETVPNDDCTLYYLDMGNGNRLELFDYYGKNKAEKFEESRVGYRHLAFEVEDVDALAKELMDNGVKPLFGPGDLPHLGARIFLFEDPDGIQVEILKPL